MSDPCCFVLLPLCAGSKQGISNPSTVTYFVPVKILQVFALYVIMEDRGTKLAGIHNFSANSLFGMRRNSQNGGNNGSIW